VVDIAADIVPSQWFSSPIIQKITAEYKAELAKEQKVLEAASPSAGSPGAPGD